MPEATNPDLDVPAEPEKAPLTIEQIKAELSARHQGAVERLAYLRKQRDKINADIKKASAEETEARRMFNAITPRKRKAPASKRM